MSAQCFRPVAAGELDEAARHLAVCFSMPIDERFRERLAGHIGRSELWGVEEAGGLLASCRLTTADHWFGGRRVACQHIAAVAVPPEHRGRGLASAMMRGAVQLGADASVALSLLFPSTTRLYRRLGWEHAGTYSIYRLAAGEAKLDGPRPTAMRLAADEGDWAGVQGCFDRAARRANGVAVRHEAEWEDLRAAAYHYVLDGEAPGEITAYALFDHVHPPDDWRYTLKIRDWAAASAAGLRAVVGLVAGHGTIGKDATFRAAGNEPWSLLVGEQSVQVDDGMYWMARGLDLATALRQRGFPPRLSGAVTLAVDDPLLPHGAGPWRVEFADGRASCVAARTAEVRLDARAVGPLFTGFRDPAQLALGGLLSGPADTLALLAAAFAGPVPSMVDFF